MFWLLSYTGEKRKWNYIDRLLVRAPTREVALNMAPAWSPEERATEWDCEEVPDDGETEVIISNWIGDQW